jgi:hypothetical protein
MAVPDPARVLLIGSGHFANLGRDVLNVEMDYVLASGVRSSDSDHPSIASLVRMAV